MTISRWLCILTAAIVAGGSSGRQHAQGLSVRADGVLIKDDVPFRGIGVNYFDAFSRTLKDPDDTSYEAGFRALAENGIPFARFMCTGFWPKDMKLYETDKAKYFTLLDGVVRAAEEHGIGLIPSLFWYMPTVPEDGT